MNYLIEFFKALSLTLSVELAIGLLLRMADRKFTLKFNPSLKSTSLIKFITAILFASILTLPYVWFIFPILIKDRLLFGISAELFAFLMETLLYHFFLELNLKSSLILSFSLNLGSFLIGLLIFR